MNGILTRARDFLISGWSGKADGGVAMQVVPIGPTNFRGEPLRPDNMQACLEANKGTVYACTDLLGEGVAATPQRVYVTKTGREKSNFKLLQTRQVSKARKDAIFRKAAPGSRLSSAADLEEVTNGPLVELLYDVNNYMCAADAKKLTVANLGLVGNAYWILLRNQLTGANGKGTPASIWFAPSADMSVIPDKDNWIGGYVYKKDTPDEIIYDADDVIHFKKVSPLSQFYGRAPLLACADAYDLEQYMVDFEKSMFKTGGNKRVIIWTKHPLDEKAGNRVKAKFKSTDDTIVLNEQDFGLQLTELNNPNTRDMGYDTGLEWVRDTIAMIFHVPKSMLTSDDVNRANSRQGMYEFQKYGLLPYCTLIDETLTEHLAPQFDERLVIISDNPVQPDREQDREDLKVNMQFGVMTPNEARALQGLEPIEGGDELRPVGTGRQQDEVETAERVYERAVEIAEQKYKYRG